MDAPPTSQNHPTQKPVTQVCLFGQLSLWVGLVVMLLLASCAVTPPTYGPPLLPESGSTAPLGNENYKQTLIQQARQLTLWENPLWHRLLHYHPNTLFSGYTSQADGPGFFNAPNGKTNPQAELEATLAGFFSPLVIEPGKMSVQCTFPARYHWLKTQLKFDANHLKEQPCERFQNWRKALDPQSVSLVFSSYYFNNPASMFGHTLLVVNKRGLEESDWLLNYALNFAAAVSPDENDIIYAVRGLFGGYQGYFTMLPYYAKVREYNDMESRDLWEYRLKFSQAGLDRMVRHAWELGSTYFDYYFLKENCSYHLLSLLEVAEPSMNLLEDFTLWTVPNETVRSTLQEKDVLEEIIFRPARGTQLRRKFEEMSDIEKELAIELMEDPKAADDARFEALPKPRKALVLDAALDYYQGKVMNNPEKEAAPFKKQMRTLLVRRARLAIPSEPLTVTPPEVRPDQSHRVSLARLSTGTTPQGNQFTDLRVQPSFHDLVSNSAGLAHGTQVNLGVLQFRYDHETENTRFERFSVADIASLAPASDLDTPLSWKFSGGWRRPYDGSCLDCVPLSLSGSVGVTLASAAITQERYFVFTDVTMEAHKQFRKGNRAGLGASAGMMLDLSSSWRILVQSGVMRFGHGQLGTYTSSQATVRASFSQDGELLLDWRRVATHQEAALGLGWHF